MPRLRRNWRGWDWVVDGVSREESETIGLLAGLAYEDLGLGVDDLGFPEGVFG